MSGKSANNVEAEAPREVEFVLTLRCPAKGELPPDVRLANLLKRLGRDHGMRCVSVRPVE